MMQVETEPTNAAPIQGTPSPTQSQTRWAPGQRSRLALITLAAIVIIAFGLRIYNLAGNPPGFFCDEASIGYNAYLVLHTGADQWGVHFPVYFKAFGEYKNPIYIYATIPFIAAMGMNILATRLPAVLFGTATVALMYPLALLLFRRRDVALLAAASLAIAPWHLLFSRVAFEAISMPFFYALATIAFLWALRRDSRRLYLASFALWGLSIYTYSVPRLLTPLLLVALLAVYHRDVLQRRRDTLIGVGIFAVMMIPLVINILTGSATARFGEIGVFSKGYQGLDLIGTIIRFYLQHFSVLYLFTFGSRPGDPVLRNFIPGMGALFWAQLPLLAIGLAGLLAKRTRAAILVLIWLLLFPLGGTLTEGPSQLRDLFGVLPFSLITGYGAAEAWRWLRHVAPRPAIQRYANAAGGVVAVGVLALCLTQLWSLFYVQYPKVSAGYWGWQWGPQPIIQYFEQVQPRYDDLFMTGTYNSPEIFLPFFAPSGCERCAIGALDRFNPARRQLFALRPEELQPGFHFTVRKTLYYGDGTVAYEIVEARRI